MKDWYIQYHGVIYPFLCSNSYKKQYHWFSWIQYNSPLNKKNITITFYLLIRATRACISTSRKKNTSTYCTRGVNISCDNYILYGTTFFPSTKSFRMVRQKLFTIYKWHSRTKIPELICGKVYWHFCRCF